MAWLQAEVGVDIPERMHAIRPAQTALIRRMHFSGPIENQFCPEITPGVTASHDFRLLENLEGRMTSQFP